MMTASRAPRDLTFAWHTVRSLSTADRRSRSPPRTPSSRFSALCSAWQRLFGNAMRRIVERRCELRRSSERRLFIVYGSRADSNHFSRLLRWPNLALPSLRIAAAIQFFPAPPRRYAGFIVGNGVTWLSTCRQPPPSPWSSPSTAPSLPVLAATSTLSSLLSSSDLGILQWAGLPFGHCASVSDRNA